MKLLCFQARRFRWRAVEKTLPDAPDPVGDQEVMNALVVFLHAEASDAATDRLPSIERQTLKHLKWLANKRMLQTVVLHSFSHLGGATAAPSFALAFIAATAERLRAAGYQVSTTPFGYSCEWDLSVYGQSLAKVWKEIH